MSARAQARAQARSSHRHTHARLHAWSHTHLPDPPVEHECDGARERRRDHPAADDAAEPPVPCPVEAAGPDAGEGHAHHPAHDGVGGRHGHLGEGGEQQEERGGGERGRHARVEHRQLRLARAAPPAGGGVGERRRALDGARDVRAERCACARVRVCACARVRVWSGFVSCARACALSGIFARAR